MVTPELPMFFDLKSDQHELYNLTSYRMDCDFMLPVLLKVGIDYKLSTVEYPNIKPWHRRRLRRIPRRQAPRRRLLLNRPPDRRGGVHLLALD